MRNRVIAMLLCVACLVPICRPVPARAVAVVDDAIIAAYGAKLVASILVASGVVFVISGAANDVAKSVYDDLASNDTFKSTFKSISGLAAWFVSHPSDVSGAALNISDKVASQVISCFQSRVSNGKYVFNNDVSSAVVVADFQSLSTFLSSHSPPYYFYLRSDDNTMLYYRDYSFEPSNFYIVSRKVLLGVSYDTVPDVGNYPTGKTLYSWKRGVLRTDYGVFQQRINCTFTDATTWYFVVSLGFKSGDFPLTVVGSSDSSTSVRADDVSVPVQRLVIAPSIPTVADSGDVIYGDLVYSAETVSVPYPLDDDGVTITDIPVDVPVSVSTGKALADEGDVVVPDDPSKPIEGTGVLSWLQSVLKGLLDKIVELLTAIRDGILSIPELIAQAVAGIFVPSDAAVEEVQTTIDAKLPVISDVKSILGNLTNLMEHPDQAASGLALTTVVDFGKHSSGTWGEAKVDLLDASWFLRYKSLTDDIVVGLAWLVFLWRLYGALPNIVHGMSGGGGIVDGC